MSALPISDLDFLVYGPRNPLGRVQPQHYERSWRNAQQGALTICFFGRYSSVHRRRGSAQIRWRSLVADRLPHGIQIGLHHEVRSFGSSSFGNRRRRGDHHAGWVNRGLRSSRRSPRNHDTHHHRNNESDNDGARVAAGAAATTSCGADGKRPAHRPRTTKPVLTLGDCAPGADGPSWRQLATAAAGCRPRHCPKLVRQIRNDAT